eukprot:TRINITY_DN44725_c0_g1_i1.p1 TRINITY_DN44725_c0_g1~~TRINITY_DN44725_c0_g1_i1.p1  ORF type:complete len:111 (-),score=4.31 TRINITY_DN44725_c0_g1_i1:133-465(-)
MTNNDFPGIQITSSKPHPKGDFEIVAGEKVLWSKLEKGRYPAYHDLETALLKLGYEKRPRERRQRRPKPIPPADPVASVAPTVDSVASAPSAATSVDSGVGSTETVPGAT